MSRDLNISELHTTDRLPEYSKGELAPEERAAVEAHLSSCPACREELELLEALLSVPAPELDPADAERLYTPLPKGRDRVWSPGVWRAAAGIVIVLSGYGIWLAGQASREIEASWSADAALAGWDADLAELRPGMLDLRVALGANGGPAWPELEGDELEGDEMDALDGTWADIE
jgi:anti-sigma factor RsiW